MYGTTTLPELIGTFFNGGATSKTIDLCRARSPITYVDQVTTPLLIMHGSRDDRVPTGQALEYFRALKDRGKTVELVLYRREGHDLSEWYHQLDKMRRSYEWIAKYTGQSSQQRPIVKYSYRRPVGTIKILFEGNGKSGLRLFRQKWGKSNEPNTNAKRTDNESFSMAELEINLAKTYDVVVVGSGAAGGMAAHVLTGLGLQVLLLEAGKQLPIEKELRSMEWPYDNPYRGMLPPDSHSLNFNEYTIRNPPYNAGFEKAKHLYSYVGNTDYLKNIVVDERENPYSGTNYAWVRARCLGGKTNIWGRLALRLSDYDFKAKNRDGYGEDWPISYSDIAPYYDKVDLYLGITGVKENLEYLPDSIFQRPTKLNCAEVTLKDSVAKMGRVLTQYRAGVTSEGLKHNKYRSRCYGRGACQRKGGCDIHAAFDSPTGLIYPARDTGNLTLRTNAIVREITVDTKTGKASGVEFIDSQTMKPYTVRAKVVVLAASTLESARLLLLSKSRLHPNGLANSSGHVGHNFCEHIMGPGVTGRAKNLVGRPATLDDGRPGGFYLTRFRNLAERHPKFIRGYGFEGGSGSTMFPRGTGAHGFGAAFKEEVRKNQGAFISMGAFGEVLARYENYVDLDPVLKDKWGIPVLRFHYKFGDNERHMAKDMAETAQEMFEAAGFEIVSVSSRVLTEGWSIHELGTARMGNDPKTSVLNQFQQSHDVKNLFVVDGSAFVSASCQNPTWTIMSLCWRSCDYLADEFRKGNL